MIFNVCDVIRLYISTIVFKCVSYVQVTSTEASDDTVSVSNATTPANSVTCVTNTACCFNVIIINLIYDFNCDGL